MPETGYDAFNRNVKAMLLRESEFGGELQLNDEIIELLKKVML